MDVIKTLSKSIREFKGPSLRAPLFVLIESLIETAIPFVTAMLINQIKDGAGMGTIGKYGIVLLVLATLSLLSGVAAGNNCATASTGFARNLRKDLFYKIQDFSFENIDHFQTSSLVTRMTTGMQSRQRADVMRIRLGLRGGGWGYFLEEFGWLLVTFCGEVYQGSVEGLHIGRLYEYVQGWIDKL